MADRHAHQADAVMLPPAVGEATAVPRASDAAGDGRGWIENRPSQGWLPHLDLRELWSFRELALIFALRNIKIRYKQTVLGISWAVLQPLAGVAIFSIVFGRLARLPSDGIPYPVFVFAGLSLWLYFSQSVNLAAGSLLEYRALVTKVYFPRLITPLAAVLPGLLELAISLAAVAAFMVIFGVSPSLALVLLPLWIVLAVSISFGVGAWFSALNVKYRDVRNGLAFLLQIWLFATPVVYPSSILDGLWRYIFALNPMVGLVDSFRWSLVGGPAPGTYALVSLAAGALIISSGVVYFRRFERRFADVI